MSQQTPPQLVVLYGSQSGCAQEVAERIASEAHQLQHFTDVLCMAMDNFDRRKLPMQNLVVFVCSTTGQGETPDNMKGLYRFLLRRDLPTDSLSSLNYAVFGLGDSSYPLFNAVARRLHQLLMNLGAHPLVERGLGDDQAPGGPNEALEPWLTQLWVFLRHMYSLPPPINPKSIDALGELKYHVQLHKGQMPNLPSTGSIPPFFQHTISEYTPVHIQLLSNKRLTPISHFQDVRQIEFQLPQHQAESNATAFHYLPGDVLFVHPRNIFSIEEIKWIENVYQLNFQTDWVEIQLATPNTLSAESVDFPQWCSVRDLFEMHLDILGTPRQRYFQQLSAVRPIQSKLEHERLVELGSPTTYADYVRYCTKEKRTYLEVLQDFKHTHLQLNQLINCIPRLQPRQFSIASSQLAHQTLQLLVAVLDITTPFKRRRTGVASSYLASLDPSLSVSPIWVPCWIKPQRLVSHPFHPPISLNTPVICFGPGTGVAPFRAMVAAREIALKNRKPPISQQTNNDVIFSSPAPFLLFFGNRNRQADFFYEQEWAQWVRNDILEFEAVFSRDNEKDKYVQHVLLSSERGRAEQVAKALRTPNSVVMIAGSAGAMVKDIRCALLHILQLPFDNQPTWSIETAISFLKEMDNHRRYLVETW
jgi:sulfite reductase alpha subunit-like flavoprotein